MSGLAEESLDERHGAPGAERLEQLMELATMEIDDFEVGADARLSFSVNKMAGASWPPGNVVCDDVPVCMVAGSGSHCPDGVDQEDVS